MAYESRPTPNPLVILPTIILQKPTVNVWIAPPKVKTKAPTKSVPLRPILSPTVPAATEVTVSYECPVDPVEPSSRTESTNLEDCNYCANFNGPGIVEVLSEVRAGDNTTHDATLSGQKDSQNPERTSQMHPWSYPNYPEQCSSSAYLVVAQGKKSLTRKTPRLTNTEIE